MGLQHCARAYVQRTPRGTGSGTWTETGAQFVSSKRMSHPGCTWGSVSRFLYRVCPFLSPLSPRVRRTIAILHCPPSFLFPRKKHGTINLDQGCRPAQSVFRRRGCRCCRRRSLRPASEGGVSPPRILMPFFSFIHKDATSGIGDRGGGCVSFVISILPIKFSFATRL